MEPTLIDENSEEDSYIIVDEVALFPECEGKEKDEVCDCFQGQMQHHSAKNFRYPEAAQKNKIPGRVASFFVINEESILEDIRAKGIDLILEHKDRRIFSL